MYGGGRDRSDLRKDCGNVAKTGALLKMFCAEPNRIWKSGVHLINRSDGWMVCEGFRLKKWRCRAGSVRRARVNDRGAIENSFAGVSGHR